MRPVGAVAITFVAAYRYLLSPILPGTCRFQPTCSAYAADAIRRHGAARGGLLALRRLSRCHPWGPWGYDPVPEPPFSASAGCGHAHGDRRHPG